MKLNDMILQTPYLSLESDFYSFHDPQPLQDPCLISFNDAAAKLIGLDTDAGDDPSFVPLLNGTFLPKGSRPFSMCYAGHQFGHYNPWLGDGRACNLGSLNGWNLQLKGSGETLYSRMADGRAALRSSIREYLMSEAMHHLGIPTTRALGIIGSKTKILRDTMEEAAIVMRMATSWIRFGSFENFYYTKQYTKLEALAEYVIAESFPHLKDDEDRFFKIFCEILHRTATTTAKWQAVGFCHGVMNTDNMSIEGLTIDYGPFSMLDDFNFNYVCNHKDRVGRYSYDQQPNISYWNLTKLSKALSPIIPKERMQKKLDEYGASLYPNAYLKEMRKKLGLQEVLEEDFELIKELVGALQDAYVDHTQFYRILSHYNGNKADLYDIAMNPVAIDNWLKVYDKRLEKEKRSSAQRNKAMLKTNPKYILKNYMLQKAIELAQKGDFSMVQALLDIAKNPYNELPEFEHFAQETPQEYKNIGLSCSS
ncbi:YdiU family protein [Sulfurimonas sediminis]|uniref:Protein nucleotidyltransferase YdiU n=1 Tax=Sulfurimonas sediminis TaxID=2590020 RepID=A0A7M1B1F3_9BACT|nr:YdiU family protein [Sulfurimonas sediminis]QOP43554.1 YdiU family protein [Sulfurimonas sediminis]